MKKQLLSLVFMAFSSFLMAQIEVSGIVVDEKGEPMAGASVVTKGMSMGVVTDFDGKFKFVAPNNSKVLVVSFVGYETQETTIKTDTPLKIVLSEGILMDEFVKKATYVSGRCCCYCGWYKFQSDSVALKTSYDGKGNVQLHFNAVTSTNEQSILNNPVFYEIYRSKIDSKQLRDYEKLGSTIGDKQLFQHNEMDKNKHLVWSRGFGDYIVKPFDDAEKTYFVIRAFSVDIFGNTRHYDSPIVPIAIEKTKKPLTINSLYANSKANQIDLNLTSYKNERAEMTIVNMNGQVVFQQTEMLLEGKNNVLLSAGQMAAGLYVLSVQQGEEVAMRKFVIVN
jgi:hypothetical protein